MVSSSLQLRTTLPSSVRPGLPSTATRPLSKPTSRANQVTNKKIPPPNNAGSQVHPETQARRCRPRRDFHWPSLSPHAARTSSSLAFITRVANDSTNFHFCSDWSMRETFVSGVSCAAQCTTDSLLCHAPPGPVKECVLIIVHKESTVATRLIVCFLEALQVRIEATMAQKRLC